MSRNPFWTAEDAADARAVAAEDDVTSLVVAPVSGQQWDGEGFAFGDLDKLDLLDLVAVDLREDWSYNFVAKGDFQPELSIFDDRGYLLTYIDGDDIGIADDYSFDSILAFQPDYAGTHYLSVNYEFNDYSGVWAVGAFGERNGDPAPAPKNLTGTGRADLLTGDGRDNILRGKAGADELNGLGGDDSLFGATGDDTLKGGSGSDRLVGGDGYDRLHGGGGDDRLTGGKGRDALFGDRGNDNLSGGDLADRLAGGAGRDRLDGGSGNDLLTGGSGNDVLAGGTGRDVLKGDAGSDRLSGDAGNDRLLGGAQADHLSGGAGRDRLFGGSGNDVLRGNNAADILKGGAGDDRLEGGKGADMLIGGGGADTFVFGRRSGQDVVRDFQDGLDVIEIASGAESFSDIAVEDAGPDTVLIFATSIIRLDDVDHSLIDAGDFAFV